MFLLVIPEPPFGTSPLMLSLELARFHQDSGSTDTLHPVFQFLFLSMDLLCQFGPFDFRGGGATTALPWFLSDRALRFISQGRKGRVVIPKLRSFLSVATSAKWL